MRLKDRVCVVTGASSGIGRAIAVRFAAEGARVVVADPRERPIEGGEPTAGVIADAGGTAVYRAVDVARWTDVDALVGETAARWGRLDVMVNNAAVYTGTGLLETTEADWEWVMAVNVKGVFLGCKRAVQQMRGQPERAGVRGRLINLASQHGLVACPGDPAYGTSKAAVAHLTRQVAAEFAPDGIACNAVAPGKILTGRTDAIGADALAYSRARTPWPRLGEPRDVAGAALYLASDDCTYVTGATLLVDGGWMAA